MAEGECEFCHEGLCRRQIEYPNIAKCEYAKGTFGECTAKPDDLIEICEDCDKPIDGCDCGYNWILVNDKDGKIVPITPKVYNLLKKGELSHG